MAHQSLYRRYRSQRFSEVKGQEQVVGALRNAVRDQRVSHAYLFSGPRGTGKTSTARILAKALNCDDLHDGEPCGTCPSCVAIEQGASYDLQELDAASNNGVEAVRDLISRVALGSPGRSKVYILDEVHMLSPAASNALLKTLEEPPPHVVFVLATTDPHKVLPTIRSRTQHFEFNLLPADVLEEHVRWVIADAGLDVDDVAVAHVLRVGGGSARDTLSALDQVAAGGIMAGAEPVERLVDAVVAADTGRALGAVAEAVALGRDPRVLGEALLARLRDVFLHRMGAELGHLTGADRQQVAAWAELVTDRAVTRALESVGAALLEMRQAPDVRIPLEVALVKITGTEAATSVEGLLTRIERLEAAVERAASGRGSAGSGPATSSAVAADAGSPPATPSTADTPARSAPSSPPAVPASPVAFGSADEASGPTTAGSDTRSTGDAAQQPVGAAGARAALASRRAAARTEGGSASPPPPQAAPPVPRPSRSPSGLSGPEPGPLTPPSAGSGRSTGLEPGSAPPVDPPAPRLPRLEPGSPPPAEPGPDGARPHLGQGMRPPADPGGDRAPHAGQGAGPVVPDGARGPVGPVATESADGGALPDRDALTIGWADEVLPTWAGLTKAMFAVGRFTAVEGGSAVYALPNEVHRQKCESKRPEVEAALAAHFGAPVPLRLVVDDGRSAADGGRFEPEIGDAPALATDGPPRGRAPDDEDEVIDVHDLLDAPADHRTHLDRLTEAFPGAQLLEEDP